MTSRAKLRRKCSWNYFSVTGYSGFESTCVQLIWKEEALDDLLWKDKRGSSSIRQTLEPLQRWNWGNCWEIGWSAYGLFQARRYHLELNWTELTWLVCIVRKEKWLALPLTRTEGTLLVFTKACGPPLLGSHLFFMPRLGLCHNSSDASKNTKATWKGCALHSYVGTVFS